MTLRSPQECVLCTGLETVCSSTNLCLQTGQIEHKSSDIEMFNANKAIRKCRWVWCNPKNCLKCQDPHWKWDVQCRDWYQTVSSWLSRVFKKNLLLSNYREKYLPLELNNIKKWPFKQGKAGWKWLCKFYEFMYWTLELHQQHQQDNTW